MEGQPDINIYEGADSSYGLNSTYTVESSYAKNAIDPESSIASFALTTDPRSANQVSAVASALNTGVKTVDLNLISTELIQNIPKQHTKEIKRLADLTGVDLTMHGPLVDPVGLSNNGYEEETRIHAETQILEAMRRSKELDNTGNIVVTLHTTNGLPEMINRYKEDGKEKIRGTFVVDENSGRFNKIDLKESTFLGNKVEGSMEEIEGEITKLNNETWSKYLADLDNRAASGRQAVDSVLRAAEGEYSSPELAQLPEIKEDLERSGKNFFEVYQKFGTPESNEIMAAMPEEKRKTLQSAVFAVNHGEVFIRDAYSGLQERFDEAFAAAEKMDNKKEGTKIKNALNSYQKEMQPIINKFGKNPNLLSKDPKTLQDFSDKVSKGINLLRSLTPPQTFQLMQDFAIDKASETYSNVAFKTFKEFGNKAPIMSIENPPAGGGISRAADMVELIDKTRERFVQQAVESKKNGGMGLSKKEAEKSAKKLIGATWDVGHINMIRKFGYDDKDLLKETKTIAPYVKHIHLSDNFGLDHTELPMGMGNVPTKQHMELIKQYNDQADKLKKVIETGTWYTHFQKSPFAETLQAFGSPFFAEGASGASTSSLYPMKMASYWNEASIYSGSYLAGSGFNPDLHHSIYGAGFSTLPIELGGQNQGGRSQFSGTPIE